MVSGGLGKSCCCKFHFSDLDSKDILNFTYTYGTKPKLSYTHGAVLLPLRLWVKRHSTNGRKKIKNKTQVSQLLIQYTFWFITNAQPNEIPLCYSLELESRVHHSNANIICMKYFASDGSGSDSGKSSFSFRVDNVTLLYHSHLLSTNPHTDYSTFPPSHIVSTCSPHV